MLTSAFNWQMRAHFSQNIFLFLLVHNSEFLEDLIIIVSNHILMWSSAQWVNKADSLFNHQSFCGIWSRDIAFLQIYAKAFSKLFWVSLFS